MSEAYETRMDSTALKIRWISVQCYEMVLPGGKTLVTDPFYWDMSHFDGLTERRADFPWIILLVRIIFC